MLVLD